MYDFFTDADFLDRARPFATGIAERVQDLVREQGISCQFFCVGSNPRNMITRNGKGPIDFDYNLNILASPDWDGHRLKETVRKCFNQAMREEGLRDVQDSTSSLTTYPIWFDDEPGIRFSIDIAIVAKDDQGSWQRLIHDKRERTYFWNQVRDSRGLGDRESWLKKRNHWTEVRERYLDIKNRYLTGNDHDHPSFVCYIEAVNEIYQKHHK